MKKADIEKLNPSSQQQKINIELPMENMLKDIQDSVLSSLQLMENKVT